MIGSSKNRTDLLPIQDPRDGLRERADRNGAPVLARYADENLFLQVQDQELYSQHGPCAAASARANCVVDAAEFVESECELSSVGAHARH